MNARTSTYTNLPREFGTLHNSGEREPVVTPVQRGADANTASNAGPWMDAAYMLPESERYCTCCERELSGHAFRYLELDQRSDTYHDLNDVPADRSQGWFPFGLTCAKKLIAKEKKRRAALAGAEQQINGKSD